MLDEKDPKFNPNDPLYKEANALWLEGLQYNPDGPRLVLERARRTLGKDVKREDRSEDLGMPRNNAASDTGAMKSKTVSLTDIESANAIRWWTTLDNPKTGRKYTEAEALSKALEAKRKRLAK